MKYYVKNLEETNNLAIDFAKKLKVGDMVLLSGDLGAGKTTFTQCVFRALGVKEVVNSPTFAVLKNYKSSICELNHFDMYRMTTPEAIECGFDELLTDRGVITFIEWAEMVKPLIPEKHISISIKIISDTEREIDIEGA